MILLIRVDFLNLIPLSPRWIFLVETFSILQVLTHLITLIKQPFLATDALSW